MNNPPPPVSSPEQASELWLALTAIPRPHKVVDMPRNFPGTETPCGKLAIVPLSQEEQMICNAEADRFTKNLLKESQKSGEANLGYEHTFSNDCGIQILFRACRDVKDINRLAFPSTTEMRRKLSADEVGILFQMYLTVQFEVGPIIARFDDASMKAWIERIAEAGSAFPFDLLSWEMQRALLRFSASRLVSFWTGTSSAGSPQEKTPNGSPSESVDPLHAPADGEPITIDDE